MPRRREPRPHAQLSTSTGAARSCRDQRHSHAGSCLSSSRQRDSSPCPPTFQVADSVRRLQEGKRLVEQRRNCAFFDQAVELEEYPSMLLDDKRAELLRDEW